MTTENKPNEAEGGNQPAPAQTPAQNSDDDKAAIRKALAAEGAARKAAEAELAKYRNAEAAKAEDEAKARGEFDKIVAERDKKISDLTAAMEAKERALIQAEARGMLAGLDKLQLKGALAEMPADLKADGVADWVAEFKKTNAELFAAPAAAGVRAGASGEPHRGTTQTTAQLREELKDPAKASAAARELERRILSGQTI